MVDYQSPGSNGNLGYALFLDSTFGDKSKLYIYICYGMNESRPLPLC